MHPRYLQLIESGCTLLTGNRALARHLLFCHAALQVGRRKSSWETPDVLPLSAWLDAGWQERNLFSGKSRLLLSAAQTRCLWEKIIAESGLNPDPLQGAALAERAVQTWNVLHEWGQETFEITGPLHQDARIYLSWAGTFAQVCLERGWIDLAAARLEQARSPDQATKAPLPRIAIAGFDIPSPLVTECIAALQRSGAAVEHVDARADQPRVIVNRCADPGSEALAAAVWARERLQDSPGSTIAVIVPDLAGRRAQIEYAFEDVLTPGARPGASADRRPFSIALGRALAEQPMIAAALAALDLVQGPATLQGVIALLQSPFIGDVADEFSQRGRLEMRLRESGEALIDLQELCALSAALAGADPAGQRLAGRFDELQSRCRQLPRSQSPRQWARAFGELLKSAGWPGARPLYSAEYQCLESWHDVLATLAGLGVVEPGFGLSGGLSELRRLLASTQFQPESGDTGIRILGPDGAADAAFDAVWFMGLDAGNWPGRADPNPFIPLALQRSLAMPGAAPETELRRAALILDRITASAVVVHLSYAQRDHDRERRPSPLLRPWMANAADVSVPPLLRYASQLQATVALESYADTDAPSLPQGWDGGGGVSLLRDQAACPFRSCARHRLRAVAVDESDLGLDAASRGVLVHGVLQRIWSRLGGQAELLRLGPAEVRQLADACVDESLERSRARRPRTFTARFTARERRRLSALAQRWLAFERDRAPFEVLACEQTVNCRAGALSLRGRMDRVDRLPDGRMLIIDYKTGRCSLQSFLGPRPDEPQLPLYALNAGGPVAAVAYAAAGAGEPAFVGVAAEPDLLPGVRAVSELKRGAYGADWGELEHNWRATLDRIATGFLDGRSAVAPKNPQACRQCNLHMLCRIHEYGSAPEDEEEDDD